ncbi:MAG: hypothetical protein QNJ38_05130 [Prochloraceae cyanobacterium]|nr:hypothetical protein [Prochloraceae cyanobacterium]
MKKSYIKDCLGSKEIAEQTARRVQKVVPAYQRFLTDNNIRIGEPFEMLPRSDKKSYALAYPFEELLGDDYEDILGIFSSSGSSGNLFYWPSLKSTNRSTPSNLRKFLEQRFAIDRKKTLAIVGTSLGSWLGGEHFSWMLKSIIMDTPYPFWVFSPGNKIEQIINLIDRIDALVDQIVIFIVPSTIAHLHLKASQLNKPLPLNKLKYIATGEPFPESVRISLQKLAGLDETTPFMFSAYGSADTGGLGIESIETVALRQLLYQNQTLAKQLIKDSTIPHFFHFIAADTYVEIIDGNLAVTKWQAIPLVRYILYDRVSFYSWQELTEAILASKYLILPEDRPLINVITGAKNLVGDLIAVTGRSDSTLVLNGCNLTEYMLDEAVKCEELQELTTGLYRAKIIYENNKQYLNFDLEIKEGVSADLKTTEIIFSCLVRKLGKVQPIFLNSWQNIYSESDRDPSKRILRLNLLPWPSLSQKTETSIKQRGILKNS